MNATVHYVNELPEKETIQRCVHCDKVVRDLDATIFGKQKKWAFPKGEVYFIPDGTNITRITMKAPRNITINHCK